MEEKNVYSRSGYSGQRYASSHAAPAHPGRGKRYGRKNVRKNRALLILYAVIILAVVVTAVVLLCRLLFKVTTITVSGSSRYSTEEILEACTIKEGDNLIGSQSADAIAAIEEKLPYIGTVTIKKKIPSKIIITVEEAKVFCVAEQAGKFILLSDKYKVLELQETMPEGALPVYGLTLISPEPGKTAEYKNDEMQKIFKLVMDSVVKNEMDKLTKIDLTDLGNISLVYDGRITMELGLPSDLDYKIAFGKDVIENKLTQADYGKLNLSRVQTTNKATFENAETTGTDLSSAA